MPSTGRPRARSGGSGPGSTAEARRRQRRQVRARRRGAALAGLILLVVVIVVIASAGGTSKHDRGARTARTAHVQSIPAVESGLLPWQLPTAISREIVLPGQGSHVTVLGGLTGSSSVSGVYALDTRNGGLRTLGSLHAGVHDAAGAIVGGRDVIFGGGTPNTVASTEAFPATQLGALPAPRSDAAATSVGNTTYIVGGYTGSTPQPAVLSTTDGRTFQTVAQLPVPVRYPAVGSVGGKLYVFGGQALSGAQKGSPVADIQEVNPAAHSARVVGQMPEPLQASAAVELAGNLYLAGGDTTTPQATTPGAGSERSAVPFHSAGSPAMFTTSTIWAFQPASRRLLNAGRLQVPVSHAGAAVVGGRAWVVGGESGSNQVTAVQMITPNTSFGHAGTAGAGSPYFGDKLLIADRGANHLLVLDTSNRITWRFPAPGLPHDPYSFFFPDDSFFMRHGTAIISNQEEGETIQQIAYPSGRVLWEFGHPHQIGSDHTHLHEPDDAYYLKNGQVTIADAQNCRVLIINPNHTIAQQIGATGGCVHHPPTTIGPDNGDTPLPNGDLLVSEVTGSWIDEFTPKGKLLWSTQLPISYPSDPQQLGPDRYLIADYAIPGQVLEFNRAGKILYRYDVPTGLGMLNQPSLVERLPSGVFMINDDYRDRMVAIDPATKALVWQYGVADRKGISPGLLNTPDGFDVLTPNGTTPTHPSTG